jgi:hypothetical protein
MGYFAAGGEAVPLRIIPPGLAALIRHKKSPSGFGAIKEQESRRNEAVTPRLIPLVLTDLIHQ